MIKKVFVVTLTLFVCYNLVVAFVETNDYISQSVNQDNLIKIQEFFDNDHPKDYIIVGSSVAANLDPEVIQDQFHNLAFYERSLFDGLAIIKASGHIPQMIFIETNFVKRSPSLKTEDLILNSQHKMLTRSSTNEPRQTEIQFAYNKFVQDKKKKESLVAWPTDNPEDSFTKIIQQKVEEYDELLENEAHLDKQLDLLEKEISYFEQKGVKIVFFEMPYHPDVCASAGYNLSRNKVYRVFPQNQYEYLQSYNCGDFKTQDGVHLLAESAHRYTKLFVEQVKKNL